MKLFSGASLLRRIGSFVQNNEKLLLALLAVVIAISGSLWYRQYFRLSGSGPVAGGTYVDGIVGTRDDLEAVAAKLTKSGLFAVNSEGVVVNHLVDGWSVNPEKTNYRFDIKKTVPSQEIIEDLNENLTLLGGAFVEDSGDNVVTVTLDQPNPNIPLVLAQPLFDYGPYKLSKLSETTAIFTRSAKENALNPYINKIVVHLFPDEAALKDALNKRKVDGAQFSEDVTGYETVSFTLPRYYTVILNINKSPFRDAAYRQNLVKGATVSHNTIVLTVPDEAQYQPIAERIKSQWEGQGVTVTVDKRSTAEITETTGPSRDFQALLTGISYVPELDPYYLWHSTQIRPPGNNLSGIKDDTVDKLIGEIESELSIPERYKKIELLHQQLFALGAAMIVEPVTSRFVVDRNVVVALPNIPFSARDRWQAVDQWYIK